MCLFVTSFCYITELNKLINKLDKRTLESRSGGFKSKIRVLSRPLTLLPPPNPTWSVTKECLQVSGMTATLSSTSDGISAVEVQTSTSTPVSMPRGIVQRQLSMKDSLTINDNTVTSKYTSEITPCRKEHDHDIDTESDDSSSTSYSSRSSLSDQ